MNRAGAALRRSWALVLALVLGAVLPAVVAGASGALSIPHNDAWSYSRIAQHFGETGRIELLGWNRAALVGQFVVLGPLARSIVVQQLFVVVLSAVLLLSVYALLRPRLSPTRAGVVLLAVALFPGYALLATSFMADVPALAASFLALAIGRRALRTESPWLFSLAMLVALWGCTIRAQAVAAPVAIVLVALLGLRRRAASPDRGARRVGPVLIIGSAVVFAVAFAFFTHWHDTLANLDAASLQLRTDAPIAVLRGAVQSWFTVAIVAGPVALAVARPWRWRWRGWSAAVVAAAAGATVEHRLGVQDFFIGNYLAPGGAYAAVLPPTKQLFDQTEWRLVVLFALVMGVVLAGVLAERRRGPGTGLDPVLWMFSALTALGTLAEFATIQGMFDRYLIGLVPAAVALVLGGERTAARSSPPENTARRRAASDRRPARAVPIALGGVALLVTGALSAALAANAFAFDRARWDAGTAIARTGVPADRVDAGLEWLGWHADGPVVDRKHTTGYGLEGLFSTTRWSCVVVTAQPVAEPGWTETGTRTYRTWLVAGTSGLWIYDTHGAGCPA
jgi:hypothetical protein